MKKILDANTTTLTLLGKAKSSDSGYRLMKFCAQLPVDEGVLLLNMITKEMVLLSQEEHHTLTESEYLRSRWFVVPENMDDKGQMDKLRWIVEMTAKKPNAITGYTILPTTDCNARCFYCYQKDHPHVHMSEETACKVAENIIKRSNGKPVSILWFGGEPLYNLPVIDTICTKLQKAGKEFTSRMISNSYLFDGETVKKAVALWNLKRIQISLDGTENVYNKSKAYIYDGESPYQVVLRNIGLLLDAKITVRIRLNIDLYNAEDLLTLVDELADRFAGKTGLSIYAHPLFDGEETMKDIHSDEEWTLRYEALHRLQDRIEARNLTPERKIQNSLKTYQCMADNGESIVIVPTGDIGLCEHCTNREFMGHVDKEEFDPQVIARWKERTPSIPECSDCIHYPNCIQLKNCTTNNKCFRQFREDKTRKVQKSMNSEYEAWRKKAKN